jgi:hypothetical protein
MAMASGVLLFSAGCEGDGISGSADAKIETVDAFLARICDLAAACPHISPTQEEINACPSGIRSELGGFEMDELERFTTYTKSQQDCILACIGGEICGRFGVGLSAISDSDVLDPFIECEQECL